MIKRVFKALYHTGNLSFRDYAIQATSALLGLDTFMLEQRWHNGRILKVPSATAVSQAEVYYAVGVMMTKF